mmetsp:Transcript_27010/g.54256  ORF Transcript_27010/g.54256 Transcript_27010/m.54256 type:complete len:129 (+) Transcript_27010:791-1177(+)
MYPSIGRKNGRSVKSKNPTCFFGSFLVDCPDLLLVIHKSILSGNLTNARGNNKAVVIIPFGSALEKYQCHTILPHSPDRLSTVLNHHTSNSGHISLLHSNVSNGTVTSKLATPVTMPIEIASTMFKRR